MLFAADRSPCAAAIDASDSIDSARCANVIMLVEVGLQRVKGRE